MRPGILGNGTSTVSAAALTIRKAQKTVAEKPEFAGTVKFVETHDFVRTEKESPTGEAHHEFKNGETYFLIGDALGKGMLKLQSNDAGGPSASPNFARPALLWRELEK